MALTTLRELVEKVQRESTTLVTYLDGLHGAGQGANYIFPGPHRRVPGADTPTPFLVNVMGGEQGADSIYASWQTWMYDDPGQEYWRLNELVEIQRKLFHRRLLPRTANGYRWFTRAYFGGTSGETVDDNWRKNLIICRFTAFGG